MSKVFYLCDRRKCVRCSYPTCAHTGDIAHAFNFVRGPGDSFFEEPPTKIARVVYCKDCLYWQSGENEAEKWEHCTLHGIDIGPHAFCSFGDLKDGASNE